jgi:23S rRNA (adenine2030-N6)-methyltransferase
VLAYRHQFHAGNFADVFKHALLAQLILLLEKKDKPFLYLDTHAGIAHYDFQHEWAQKNAEYKSGIALVWKRNDAPQEMAPYLAAVHAENPNGTLRYYPGSPSIARRLIRAHDRMVLTELNKKDYESLATLYGRDKQVVVQLLDGYQALKAHLPPKERRGLILIDSSFDRAREFQRLARGCAEAYRRFSTGVYALWYPLMDAASMQGFERNVVASGIRKILQLEFEIRTDGAAARMRGCGMMVINPPFGFEAAGRSILKWLWPLLSERQEGQASVRWLVPE